MKILMVCLGNICRSPLAEGILKKKVEDYQLDWEIDSAGTGYWHIGENPDPRSIEVAKRHGIDISNQRARQLRPKDLQEFDLIFAMDASNFRNILTFARLDSEKEKVEMIMNLVHPKENSSVPDPYYNSDGFEQVFEMLEIACQKIVERYSSTIKQ